jgi:hypothetical protein
VAESHSVEPARWRQISDLVIDSFAGRFSRVEPRRAAAGFVTGLLAVPAMPVRTLEARNAANRCRYTATPRPTPAASLSRTPASRSPNALLRMYRATAIARPATTAARAKSSAPLGMRHLDRAVLGLRYLGRPFLGGPQLGLKPP